MPFHNELKFSSVQQSLRLIRSLSRAGELLTSSVFSLFYSSHCAAGSLRVSDFPVHVGPLKHWFSMQIQKKLIVEEHEKDLSVMKVGLELLCPPENLLHGEACRRMLGSAAYECTLSLAAVSTVRLACVLACTDSFDGMNPVEGADLSLFANSCD